MIYFDSILAMAGSPWSSEHQYEQTCSDEPAEPAFWEGTILSTDMYINVRFMVECMGSRKLAQCRSLNNDCRNRRL